MPAAPWLAILLLAAAMAEADPPRPHWIWAPQPPAEHAYFRKTFLAQGEVEKATVLILADDRATVFLDGRQIGEAVGYQRPMNLDVGRLESGTHVLAVEAANASGAAGLLLRLDIELADGSRQRVSSDSSWVTATREASGWQSPEFGAADWTAAADLGPLGIGPWGDPTGEIDDYNQWKQAVTGQATDPTTISVPQGFEVDLVRTAQADEGSWISIDFDPRGRLVVAREDRGLLRFTLQAGTGEVQVETINDSLEECRGLLHAHGALYVNANNSKALYRLHDTDGDDRFDKVELLRRSEGGVGHGRNDLALGPDGMIYLIHGNNVRLSDEAKQSASPLRHYAEDRLLDCEWDAGMFDSDVRAPAGHLIRTDREARRWEVVAGGMRNCYGIDFNPDGELFTYESDMEWDIGLPWYRPTRVLHLISGGDYGYRQGTRMWSTWSPDAVPSSLDIGKGSPTGVKFGTRSRFPPRYRRALFISDWAYGRIFAVHLTPRGAGYDCSAELFVKGRPLNVTDLDFGPDGAMYFVVGGRRTQSALYRIRYVGPPIDEPLPTPEEMARDDEARRSRELRHELETFHGHQDVRATDFAWPHLGSDDIWIRHAARVAIEAQPLDRWRERVSGEEHSTRALTALMALARVADPSFQPQIFARLGSFPLDQMSEEQQLIALRTYGLTIIRMGRPERAGDLAERLDACYPSTSPRVNQELCGLLVRLGAPSVVGKTMPLVLAAKTQEERLRYLFALRNVAQPWTIDQRRTYFEWLSRPDAFAGAHTMPLVVGNIRKDASATLTDGERAELAPLLAALEERAAVPQASLVPRPFVWDWKLADLSDALDQISANRDFVRGRELYSAALCDRCHRLAGRGASLGPELTACGNRFGRKDLLETILSPSKFVDEKYRDTSIELADGKVVTGRITGDDGRSLTVATNPLEPARVVKIEHGEIVSRTSSLLSPMPSGLLNTFTRDEILDLLAYLIADGEESRFPRN
jgi:putative heme-binding domain-containing protein